MVNPLSIQRIKLICDNEIASTDCNEVSLHILTGSCTIKLYNSPTDTILRNIGNRKNVFEGLPTTVLLSQGITYNIVTQGHVDLLKISYEIGPLVDSAKRIWNVIRPEDVTLYDIGSNNTLRTVRAITAGNNYYPFGIQMGETVQVAGNISSWPEHHFEKNITANDWFDEIFVYFTRPKDGYATQKRRGYLLNNIYVDDSITVKSGDMLQIPLGYHPVKAGENNELLYVWVHVGGAVKEYNKWAEDTGYYR